MNVWGDSIGAGVVETLSKTKLLAEDDNDEMNKGKHSYEVHGPMIKGKENPAYIQDSSHL